MSHDREWCQLRMCSSANSCRGAALDGVDNGFHPWDHTVCGLNSSATPLMQ
jgi:hypothetical protein